MLLVLILLLQLVLPLGAVVWLGWCTPASRVGFWLHIVTSVLLILTAAVAGLWTALPWWLPLAYAVALLLTGAAVYGGGNVPEVLWPTATAAAPSGRSATSSKLHLALCTLLALLCLARLGDVGLSRLGGNPQTVDLAFPLPAGDYLIADAGRPPPAVTATQTITQRMTRFSAWRSRSAGVDIVRVNAWGLRATGLLPSTPSAYFIYGTPVLAPCDGNVDAAVANRPDQAVPQADPEHPTGNYVLIRCTLAVVLLANLLEASRAT